MPSSLRDKREALVHAHMESEVQRRFDETLSTFREPRYEIVPTGDVYAGAEPVRAMLEETLAGFPDFHFEKTRLYHADDAVFVETEFRGTHRGSWRGLPPTGRSVAYSMCNVFVFDGEDLTCERLYFDLLTALRQLGIARDPTTVAGRIATFVNHPVVVGRAFADQLRKRAR